MEERLMQMFDNNILTTTGGLALSVLGLSAGDVVAWVSAIAAIIHALFLVAQLVTRFVIAIRKRVRGEITDTELVDTVTDIAADAGEIVTKGEYKNDFAE